MNRTVLLVDDDRTQLEAMVRGLRRKNFDALAAENLEHANQLLQTRPIDAIVSDECMPGVSGTMFLSSVAEHYPDVVRILLTGRPSFQVATDAINRAKVCYFLTKPIQLAELMKLLDAAIADRIRAREALRRAQKMSTLGQYTSGIVHDFNNLLTVMMGSSEFVLRDMDPQDRLREKITAIRAACDRAAALTRQLLAFSREEKTQNVVFSPNQVVLDIQKLLVHLVGSKVSVETVLAPDVPNVRTDPYQLEQTLFNLAVNARDAMPKGGHLTITTINTFDVPPPNENCNCNRAESQYALISVSDTGCGIPEAAQKRVFEPFFTTKEHDKGTGLGLAMVNDFIKGAGGNIELKSVLGEGTTFKLWIPAIGNETRSAISIADVPNSNPSQLANLATVVKT